MSTVSQKRPRACDACHSIKIKCELGTSGGAPPCQRCVRLNRECTVSPPRRQKERVAELEAKVEALTRLLEAQGLNTLTPETGDDVREEDGERDSNQDEDTTPSTESSSRSKKRRRDVAHTTDADASTDKTSFVLDHIVSIEAQRAVLHRFKTEMLAQFPILAVPEDLETLRSCKPTLLQAIIYAAGREILTPQQTDAVARIFMGDAACSTLAAREKTMELLQSIQVTSTFYWAPRHHGRVAAFKLAQLAMDTAVSLGISGPSGASETDVVFSVDGGPLFGPASSSTADPADSWRAWAVCYMLSSTSSFYRRQPNPLAWNVHNEEGLGMLGYSPHALPSDQLLCQYVRAERLCSRIISELALDDPSTVNSVSDYQVQATMLRLQGQILDWQAQIPQTMHQPGLMIWPHFAEILLNESVLHTSTNKGSFTAIYIAERLSITDFPAPVVTAEHIHSLHALQRACHAILDIACHTEIRTQLGLPSLFYGPRVAYPTYILMKLYISVTAFGTTFGDYLRPSELRLREYLERLVDMWKEVNGPDHSITATLISSNVKRMLEWLQNYDATLSTIDLPDQSGLTQSQDDLNWKDFPILSEDLSYGDRAS